MASSKGRVLFNQQSKTQRYVVYKDMKQKKKCKFSYWNQRVFFLINDLKSIVKKNVDKFSISRLILSALVGLRMFSATPCIFLTQSNTHTGTAEWSASLKGLSAGTKTSQIGDRYLSTLMGVQGYVYNTVQYSIFYLGSICLLTNDLKHFSGL